jgi:hypothetical protein
MDVGNEPLGGSLAVPQLFQMGFDPIRSFPLLLAHVIDLAARPGGNCYGFLMIKFSFPLSIRLIKLPFPLSIR